MSSRFTTKRGNATFLGKLASVLAVSMVMALLVASVCPEIHHLFHTDSDSDSHECVVTAFAHGNGVTLPVDFTVAAATSCTKAELLAACEIVAGQIDYRLLPACGPPDSSQLV